MVPLQGELYLLTQPGGPRYAARRVNKLAFETLDDLFPAGRYIGNQLGARREYLLEAVFLVGLAGEHV